MRAVYPVALALGLFPRPALALGLELDGGDEGTAFLEGHGAGVKLGEELGEELHALQSGSGEVDGDFCVADGGTSSPACGLKAAVDAGHGGEARVHGASAAGGGETVKG
jgi:hypothetical protein